MVLLFGGTYGSKMVITEEDTDVKGKIGVGVMETGTRGGGRSEGVYRWGVFPNRGRRRVFIKASELRGIF